MKDYVLVIWSIIVMILLGAVLYIGFYEKKNEESIYIKRTIKQTIKKYIDLENIEIKDSIRINFEELKDKEYIEELKYKDKTCKANTTVQKHWIFKTYKIDYACK